MMTVGVHHLNMVDRRHWLVETICRSDGGGLAPLP